MVPEAEWLWQGASELLTYGPSVDWTRTQPGRGSGRWLTSPGSFHPITRQSAALPDSGSLVHRPRLPGQPARRKKR
jgi:hypothetical protein